MDKIKEAEKTKIYVKFINKATLKLIAKSMI
jgi:hypothetical protein